jgi:hypothetical protein
MHNSQFAIDNIRTIPLEKKVFLVLENKVEELENLVDTLITLKFEKDDRSKRLYIKTIHVGPDFTLNLYKRRTSSVDAKRKAYYHTGTVSFIFGPERKLVTTGLDSERSYTKFITGNIRYILQRAIQHFQLDTKEVLVSEKLACYLK